MEQFDLLTAKSIRRCVESFRELDDWSPSTWARKMRDESDEALDAAVNFERLYKAAYTDDDVAEARKELAHEIADVISYAVLLAARCDIDLWQAVVEKFNIVSDRVRSPVRLP